MNRTYITLLFLISVASIVSIFLYLQYKPQSLWPPTLVDFRRIREPAMLDLPAIRSVCDEHEWIPNVYIMFEYRMGALNAINRLQVCMRWAMDAGIGLVTPLFITRYEGSLSLLGQNPAKGLDYFFDGDFVFRALQHNCPQMTILNLTEIGPHNTIRMHHKVYQSIHNKPGKFRKFVRKLLSNSSVHDPSFDSRLPTIIQETDEPLLNWKVPSDPIPFQFAFHTLFKLNPGLVEIADKIMENLPYLYIGLHMRMEEDWGPNRKTIAEFVMPIVELVGEASIHTVYVACGDLTQFQAFKNLSASHGLHVVGKWDLVTEQDKKHMETLGFDQLGIVDYEVLFHSSYFVGTARSSFSSSVGLRRHIAQYGNFKYREADAQQYMIGQSIMFYDHLW